MSQGGLWSERIRYDAENRIQYIAKAVAGSAESALVWQISRYYYDGTSTRILDVLWAEGDSSQKWSFTLRETYTYS